MCPMAEATRIEAREVTENYTVTRTEYLKPGDRVTDSSPLSVQVDRIETIPGKVVLELSEEEAQFLADVLASVGGDYRHSRRKFQVEITDALRDDVGITFSSQRARDLHGNIMVRLP